jgi:hypothetical protein
MGLNTSVQQVVERLIDLNRYLLYFPEENLKQNNFVQPMSGLIDTNPKRIIAGEARNSLKLGNASVREKQETKNPISSLTLPDEWQKKTVNPTLKSYGSSHRVED